MKSLGVYYWYVKMPWCGCVEHGLEYFSFYVQKHIADLAVCSGRPASSLGASRGARINETRLFPTQKTSNAKNISTWWRHHEKRIFLLMECFLSLQRFLIFSHSPSIYFLNVTWLAIVNGRHFMFYLKHHCHFMLFTSEPGRFLENESKIHHRRFNFL